ncbi:MAG TPA: cytochrome c biogenesis protein CcdA [Vicinamibacterales bacterium]|jgi:cytochrome c-type biogenesis protein|nr:cytochrome c biogenesis protein CcdA [Vicinamibacterales bacterium]
MVENPTFLAAFAAGVLSFISPCVLPLIPGYLSYISGLTLDEMQGTGDGAMSLGAARRRVLVASIFFILGFSFVFICFGAAASVVGQYMLERQRLLAKIAAVIVIVFGLHTMGVLRIGWLYSEKRVQVEKKPTSLFGAFFVGLAFAFGWTPCIGPILAGILAIAGTQQTVGQGVQLLAVYSAGLGLPFLLTAFAINQFFTVFKRIRKHYHLIEIISGLLLVLIGLLIFTNRFTLIAKWLTPYLPTF